MEPQDAPTSAVETVLPRPVEPLPMPAIASATRKLADKLADLFTMSPEAAAAFAQAVVDPATARRAAENPERLPVPGGTVLGVRTDVWSRWIMPDPRNPRIGPARRHPASNLVGRDESSRFRPLPEPETVPGNHPELAVQLQSQEHLAWAGKQARDYVLDQNDWRDSIKNQGVMTEVWLAATTFAHGDGVPPVTVAVTAEGSSRMTAVHDLLGVRSADVPYARDERKFRAHIRRINDSFRADGQPEEVAPDTAVALRCETVPALLLVGFEPHDGAGADFAVAVKSLVALRHVDPPKPWGAATENEALADAVIAELERRHLITSKEADWLAGALTPAEATAAGFSADPAVRAATIVHLFTDRNPQIHLAVRTAITSQSTRTKIKATLLLDIGTSLILRSVAEDDSRKRERIRKYLKDAYSVDLVREDWTATFRTAEDLAAEALTEVRAGSPGPASRELAVRCAYPLVVNGHLTGDRGTAHNDQPDRRKPGEVLDRMRNVEHGALQLRQALLDHHERRRMRQVDEAGHVVRNRDGGELLVRDPDLRRTFPPAGQPLPTPAAATTAELLHNALAELGQAVHEMEEAVKKVDAVHGDDGTPAIDTFGADRGDCEAWTQILFGVVQRLPIWQQKHNQRNGAGGPDHTDDVDELDEEDLPEELDGDEIAPDADGGQDLPDTA